MACLLDAALGKVLLAATRTAAEKERALNELQALLNNNSVVTVTRNLYYRTFLHILPQLDVRRSHIKSLRIKNEDLWPAFERSNKAIFLECMTRFTEAQAYTLLGLLYFQVRDQISTPEVAAEIMAMALWAVKSCIDRTEEYQEFNILPEWPEADLLRIYVWDHKWKPDQPLRPHDFSLDLYLEWAAKVGTRIPHPGVIFSICADHPQECERLYKELPYRVLFRWVKNEGDMPAHVDVVVLDEEIDSSIESVLRAKNKAVYGIYDRLITDSPSDASYVLALKEVVPREGVQDCIIYVYGLQCARKAQALLAQVSRDVRRDLRRVEYETGGRRLGQVPEGASEAEKVAFFADDLMRKRRRIGVAATRGACITAHQIKLYWDKTVTAKQLLSLAGWLVVEMFNDHRVQDLLQNHLNPLEEYELPVVPTVADDLLLQVETVRQRANKAQRDSWGQLTSNALGHIMRRDLPRIFEGLLADGLEALSLMYSSDGLSTVDGDLDAAEGQHDEAHAHFLAAARQMS